MPAQAQAGVPGLPDMKVSVRQLFGIDTDLEVPAYAKGDDHVPDMDNDYVFNREVTLAILAGFKHNRRVMIQGYHGTGKSTHIEQVAARLNWPCMSPMPLRVPWAQEFAPAFQVGRWPVMLSFW